VKTKTPRTTGRHKLAETHSPIGIRLPLALMTKLRVIAEAEKRSLSAQVSMILENYLLSLEEK